LGSFARMSTQIIPTATGKNNRLARIFLAISAFFALVRPSYAQTFTTILIFGEDIGIDPQYMSLVQTSDGDLYGTTYEGGANNGGTIFRITPLGKWTTLYSFCSQANCSDGLAPDWGLVQSSSGNFYGMTVEGGVKGYCLAGGCGTVFEITPGGAFTTLYSFCAQPDCSDGQSPGGPLLWTSSGALYGTTESGGITNNRCNGTCGTVFTISPAGELTTLHSFDGADGSAPLGGVIQGKDGNLYGTTFDGGANDTCPTGGCGTVFKMTTGGSLTTLYSFCSQTKCADGATPSAGLVQGTDGNFYGTTVAGGETTSFYTTGAGTVFKITPEGTLTTLHAFNGTDGGGPTAVLIQASDGNFYGTTQYGGASNACAGGCGTIFKMTAAGNLTTLYSFCVEGYPCPDGYFPVAGLTQASNEEFYGTTAGGGGTSDDGTLFTLAIFPTARLSPTFVSFGDQALNETAAAKTVTLKNIGTFSLTLAGIAVNGDFAITANTCGNTLPAGKACKIGVDFTPIALGPQNGMLTFTTNSVGSPQLVALSGTGVEPAALTPASSTYKRQSVGTTSAAKTFTLSNKQKVTLTSIAISTTGDFAVSATTCTASLAAGKKCTISVTFTPTEAGTRVGTLRVSDNVSNGPQASSLTGTGTSD
jgi:uncharacterized repeat protein (TIGR03803 family)